MDADAIDEILAALRAGRVYRVPFGTRLFPDTQALHSELRGCGGGGFELTTAFREFAPGHGWSVEQHETEFMTEAQVRAALAGCARTDVAPR